MGTAVIGGMVAATMIAIFIIPALYVIVERLAGLGTKPVSRSEGISEPRPVEAH
jgi:hypothetical protein